jgi:hypothetical protein
MSDHADCLCCICNSCKDRCKCLRTHRLAGFTLVGMAIFLGLLNIAIWSYVSMDFRYQDQVTEHVMEFDPF